MKKLIEMKPCRKSPGLAYIILFSWRCFAREEFTIRYTYADAWNNCMRSLHQFESRNETNAQLDSNNYFKLPTPNRKPSYSLTENEEELEWAK